MMSLFMEGKAGEYDQAEKKTGPQLAFDDMEE
jgi:hypothetical protein